jgi:hypothetical protein
MTLEELKQLKEKTDSLLFTFQNDRQILQEEKQKREEKLSSDFDTFLDELKEYSNLVYLNCEYFLSVLSDELLEEENLREFRAFIRNGVYLSIFHEKAKGKVIYTLTDDTMQIFDMDTYKELKNILQKTILKYSEKVKETLGQLVELSLTKKLEDEKKLNDKLFNQIKDLEK